MGFQSASDRGLPVAERYSVAIVTLDEEMFRDMRRALAPNFRATLASTESQIKTLIDDADTHGIVLDLESIGEGAADGIEVLQEMRRLRDDLIMVAITVSTGSELSLQASQAGADHFFLKPVDGEQLRTVLLQTLEKRALQFEGRWLLEQVENRSAFCGLIGGSEAMRRVYQAIEAVAGSNASVAASPARARTSAVASAAAGAVSRFAGSAMICSAGTRPSNAARLPASCTSFVNTKMFSLGTTPPMRRTVSSSIVRSEKSFNRCFGMLARLIGQKRSPLPPAMTHA